MTDRDTALARFREFLEQVFSDNTEDEAMTLWRYRVEVSPELAKADLDAIDAIVADPPDDLAAILAEDGWIHLHHRPDDETVTPYSQDETVDWLRALAERLRSGGGA
jgi:hypothetical protein